MKNSYLANAKLRWALNSATVMNCEWDDEFALWEKFGWRAVEVWYSKIEKRLEAGGSCEQLRLQMQDAGITPVGLCAGAIGTSRENVSLEEQTTQLAKRLDVAAAIGAPSLTVVVLGAVGNDLSADYDFVAERLRAAAEQAAAHGVLINLEFLGGLPINGTLGSGIELVQRVDHPSLGLLFDFCHYYVSASHLEELSLLTPEKLFMVHVDDCQKRPMEALSNEQRTFPGEGRIDVAGMISHLQQKQKYDGYWSVELYDKEIWEMDAEDVLTRLTRSLAEIERQVEIKIGEGTELL